jgi:hypothetical protein
MNEYEVPAPVASARETEVRHAAPVDRAAPAALSNPALPQAISATQPLHPRRIGTRAGRELLEPNMARAALAATQQGDPHQRTDYLKSQAGYSVPPRV